jgi:hypothetical protein
MPAMPKTRRRKRKPVEQPLTMTIADYYLMKLAQRDPTQPTYDEYRQLAV